MVKRGTLATWSVAGMLAVGLVLLIAAALGDWTQLGDYPSAPPRRGERFNAGLVREIRSYDDLLRKSRVDQGVNLSAEGIMNRLYGLVTERFTHREASHTFLSNWVAFGLGAIHPSLAHIWDVDLMVRKGYSLLCDQASFLLLRLAHDHGIKVRHVGLNGHVVMEAWYGGDWHLYDPDLEVVPMDSAGLILSVEGLSRDRSLLDTYYGRHGMVEIVGSREDDNYVSYPEGARFTWQAELLSRLETVSQGVKYFVPMVLLLVVLRLLIRAR